MINLLEISQKISELLNDIDNPLRIDNERVLFNVATEGYRLNSIDNREKGKNEIPVFIGLAGGENNPIPNLKQTSKSVRVAIYYPIAFKDNFYDLEDYLNGKLVAKKIDFGTLTGVCLTNMGVVEYGEIVQIDKMQFKDWIDDTFKQTIDVSDNWFSMVFTLYATSLGDGFLFGNDVSYKLKMNVKNFNVVSITAKLYSQQYLITYTRAPSYDTQNNYAWQYGANIYTTKINPSIISGKIQYLANNVKKIYSLVNPDEDVGDIVSVQFGLATPETITELTEDVVWSSSGTGSSISPISQQLIDVDEFAVNYENIINYNKSLLVYIKPNTDFGGLFLCLYNRQLLNFIESFILVKNYSNGFNFEYKQISLNINENVELGSPLSFTITLGDKK